MPESAYRESTRWGARTPHHYGDNIHVLADPWSLTLAAHLSHPDTHAPRFHRLVEAGYRRLMEAMAETLPLEQVQWPTRMSEVHPGAAYSGPVLAQDAPVILVDIARGGMIPSYVMQQGLLEMLPHNQVRVDHIYMQRVAGADGRVDHVETSGSKIGGPIEGATLWIPDPMAATGSSIHDVLAHYKNHVEGTPRAIVTGHLIMTSEYARRMSDEHPDVQVYALRVDRGLSEEAILQSPLGRYANQEVGLNDHDYIVPGAGGLGELLNNAFV